jgi:hypothetical protein
MINGSMSMKWLLMTARNLSPVTSVSPILVLLVTMTLTINTAPHVHAQDNRELLRSVMQDDSDFVDVLAMADSDVQTAWLITSSAGEAVARVSALQEQSQTQFTDLARTYPRETQTDMWNVSRYDALVERLAKSSLSEADINAIVAGLPDDTQQSARRLAKQNPELFIKMNTIRTDFERKYSEIMRSYPDSVQRSMSVLRSSPEVLALMNDNMRTTILFGDVYKRDAQAVRDALRERNLELVSKKANDVREWQAKVENDAEAKTELQQSAEAFAQEESFDATSEWAGPPPERWRIASYAYWTGYPWWYSSPQWYPYPLWYHTGYTVVRGRWIWWGTPSWYFLRWHFGNHRRVSLFPHLTSSYLDFWLFGPRRYNPWCRWEARHWYRFYTPRFPYDFRSNRLRRIDCLRSFTPGPVVRRRPSDRPIGGRPVPGINRPVVPLRPLAPPRVRPSREPWVPGVAPRTAPTPPRPDVPVVPRRSSTPDRMPAPDRAPSRDRAPVAPPAPPRVPPRMREVAPRPSFPLSPKAAPAPSSGQPSGERPK